MNQHVLPNHLQDALHQRQNNSEILIGWVQLSIVCLWAFMYWVSPKAYPADAVFVPVPWALGIYSLFTMVRLFLAYRHQLRRGVLVLSVIVDIALLMSLVWSFHLQYGQPPAFALKIPTMMYVFLFIPIRALRFDAGYVILAGAGSCLGWISLVCYAIYTSPADAGVTRDFVQYMTDNRILIGAEIDKIVTIAAVTAVLAIAIMRARRTMIDALHNSATASNLSRFVPAEIAHRIKTTGRNEADQPQTRDASILFVDVEGFTAMGESMAPEALIASLNEYFGLVVKPIEKNGGAITQFQGDAILASFNLPAADASHALSAVRAATSMLQALASHRFSNEAVYKVRIGVCTGSVTGGLVGVEGRVSYTVHGDAVNLAARLEQLNKTYNSRLLIDAATNNAITGHYQTRQIGTVKIRCRQALEPVFTVD